jgi:hypothetical protein
MPGSDHESTNLQLLGRSRTKVRTGDIFTFKLLDGPYRFGRVIDADLPPDHEFAGAFLVYIYDTTSETAALPAGALTPDRLLVPPLFTNRQGWLRGYFLTLGSEPIRAGDRLEQHCFEDWVRHGWVDENHVAMPERIEPCGEWGLFSHRTIDDTVSRALGIPEAAD